MNGKCPIQVVEDRRNVNNRWLTLEKYISKSKDEFENIIGWSQKEFHNVVSLTSLVHGRNGSPIYDSDVIRNPTIQELIEISDILKSGGYRLNLKTYKLIKL